MTKPIARTAFDGREKELSDASATWNPDPEVGARQEFKEDADINNLLRRYGAVPASEVDLGWFDDSLTLQNAYLAVQAAKASFQGLPQNVKDHFHSWEAMYQAIARGDVQVGDFAADVTKTAPIAPENGVTS